MIGVTFGYTTTPIADLEPDYVADHFDQVWPMIEHALHP